MPRKAFLVFLVCGLILDGTAHAQNPIYQPLGTWTDPRVEALSRWEELKVARSAPTPSIARPQLPGLRPASLLEDWLQRKRPKTVNSPKIARDLILRLARRNPNLLAGEMAEALFQESNPDWAPVRSPNAPQHDFTRPRLGGGPPENLQVKFHADGDAATYVRDMKRDWLAHRFAVPNDHVPEIRARLNEEYNRLHAVGDNEGAREAQRNLHRLQGAGFTAEELLARQQEEIAHAAHKQYAGYVSFGAALILTLGPTAWEAINGSISSETAAYRATRGLNLLGVGIGTDMVLQTIKHGALRGTLRGNLITATMIELFDITMSLYQRGWMRAFNDPNFYEEAVGGISAVGVGTVTFWYVSAAASETGWWAPVIGLGASLVTGTAAHIGGSSATRKILELVAPEMLRQQEREQLAALRCTIEQRLVKLQAWPPGPTP